MSTTNTPSRVHVLHGPNDDTFDVAGASAFCLRSMLRHAFNISQHAVAFVNGNRVHPTYRVRDRDRLEFVVPWGRKGSDDVSAPEPGRLLTVKEAAADLHCSISFVYKLMHTGQIAYEGRGRRKLPLAVSVAEYRRRNTHSAASSQPPRPGKSARQPYQFQRLFKDDRPRPAG